MQTIEALRTAIAEPDPDWLVLRSRKMWDPEGLVQTSMQERYCLTRHAFPPRNYLMVYRLATPAG